MHQYQNANGEVVEAVQWDGVGLPPGCPQWLRDSDGRPLHLPYSILQSDNLLFVNTPEKVLRAHPGDVIVNHGAGVVSLWSGEAFNAAYTLVPEPEPEPEAEPEAAPEAEQVADKAAEEAPTANDPE